MARTNPRFYSDKIHRQIVLDLAIKTLIVDQQKIENFKSHFAMTALFENSIQKLQKDLREVKAELGELGIKIEPTPKKQDDLFVIYTAFSAGQMNVLNMSLALSS